MAQQQQQQGGDHSMAAAWIMGLVFLSLYVLWSLAKSQIVSFVFYFNIIEATLVNAVLHDDKIDTYIYLLKTMNHSSVEFKQLVELSDFIGLYVRYPVIFIIIVLSFFLYRSDLTAKYKRNHSMQTLRKQEQANWPAISPIVNEDLVNVDINEGPWAMALSPMEFAKKNNLLKKNDILLDKTNYIPGQEMTASIRRGDAKRVFTLQLGPAFNGFDKVPIHVSALAAVFMARINRDKAAAEEILVSLDKSYQAGSLKAPTARAVLKKYINTEIVQEIFVKHAYLLTVLASLLKAARDDGVVPSSEFLWLKVVDRRLWYMLNCVGRQTPFVEVGGPFAHWRAEQEMGRSCRAPMIDEAIKALEVAVKEIKLSPKELRELEP